MFETSTRVERDGLSSPINMTDAHSRLDLDEDQQAIVARLPELWRIASLRSQGALEDDFRRMFCELAGETERDGKVWHSLLSYSASCATRIVGKCLFDLHGVLVA